MAQLVLALDQGTTSSRAIVFAGDGRPVCQAQRPLTQIYPQPGWVEHDPREIWETQLRTAQEALARAGASARDLAAIGITNQRETVVLWDRATGLPLHNAIVWQDRRTADICDRMRADGLEPAIQKLTGLLLDPYFSASKLSWLLTHVEGARQRADGGELAFGTVDSWLLWNLTGGRVHATDVTNASRTLLVDLETMDWSDELLRLFSIPREVLPEIRFCSGSLGMARPELLGFPVPVTGMAGDQQAATFGQACTKPGMVKNTYGTGSFLLMNTGSRPMRSSHRLLATVAWSLPAGSVAPGSQDRAIGSSSGGRATEATEVRPGCPGCETTYALEGSVFVTGAAIQWLRDEMGVLSAAAESEALAASVPDSGGVCFVPAFTGLGAPHWDSRARGAITGLTRGTGRAHIVRAALEAACFQTRDVIESMEADCGRPLAELRVDGGMTANNLMLQMQADLLGKPVRRPLVTECTALGAAFFAGIGAGIWRDEEDIGAAWRVDRTYEPHISVDERDSRYAAWRQAVRRAAS